MALTAGCLSYTEQKYRDKKERPWPLFWFYRHAGLSAAGRQIDKDLGSDQQAVVIEVVGFDLMQVVANPLACQAFLVVARLIKIWAPTNRQSSSR